MKVEDRLFGLDSGKTYMLEGYTKKQIEGHTKGQDFQEGLKTCVKIEPNRVFFCFI